MTDQRDRQDSGIARKRNAIGNVSSSRISADSGLAESEMAPSRVNLWPAAAFLPLLLSGRFKSAGFSTVLGVDTTLAALTILLVTALVTLLRGGRYPDQRVLSVMALSLWIAISLFWGPATSYQTTKAQAFFFIALPCVVSVAILVRRLGDLRGYLLIWALAGVMVAVAAAVLPSDERLYGRESLSGDTLGTAYLACSAAVVVLFGVTDRWIRPLPAAIMGVPVLLAVFGIGSRGPIVALACAFLWWMVTCTLRLRLKAVTLGVVIVSAATAWALAPAVSQARLALLVDPTRGSLRSLAFESWLEHPLFGQGFGSFSSIATASYAYSEQYVYPHNLFAESAAELGLVGLLIVSLVVVLAALNVWRFRRMPEVRALGGLAVIWLVGQQFSSDLTNRYLWLTIGACLVVPQIIGATSGRWPTPTGRKRRCA